MSNQSNREQLPLLRAIDGGAQTSSTPVGRLVLVEEGTQLATAMPWLPRPRGDEHRMLVYTTLAALEAAGLEVVLDHLQVRRVVDLRVAPAFGALAMRRAGFDAALAEHGVHYLHLRALANPYVADSWHAENYRQRLRRYYAEHPRALRLLRHSLDDGPVLILAAERSAIEFELLVRALRRVEDGFEAHTLPARRPAQRFGR